MDFKMKLMTIVIASCSLFMSTVLCGIAYPITLGGFSGNTIQQAFALDTI